MKKHVGEMSHSPCRWEMSIMKIQSIQETYPWGNIGNTNSLGAYICKRNLHFLMCLLFENTNPIGQVKLIMMNFEQQRPIKIHKQKGKWTYNR